MKNLLGDDGEDQITIEWKKMHDILHVDRRHLKY